MLIFRYVAIIAFGIFVAIGKKKLSIVFYLMCLCISITYIYLTMYKNMNPIITKWWIGTSLWACLYIIPIMTFFIDKKISFFPLEIIGRASYHIFLTQMVFYNGAHKVYSFTNNVLCRIFINVFICVALGLVFYYADLLIRKIYKYKVKDGKNSNELSKYTK